MHVRISCKLPLEKCRCRHFHRLQNADGKFLAQGIGVPFSVGAFANPKNRVHSKRVLLTIIVKKAKNSEERQKDREREAVERKRWGVQIPSRGMPGNGSCWTVFQ
jgi:hypothetical protein